MGGGGPGLGGVGRATSWRESTAPESGSRDGDGNATVFSAELIMVCSSSGTSLSPSSSSTSPVEPMPRVPFMPKLRRWSRLICPDALRAWPFCGTSGTRLEDLRTCPHARVEGGVGVSGAALGVRSVLDGGREMPNVEPGGSLGEVEVMS